MRAIDATADLIFFAIPQNEIADLILAPTFAVTVVCF